MESLGGEIRRISMPVELIKERYDVIVVGSGYGGAIAASRMARAGRSVCLLERGREFQPGEYPSTEAEAAEQFQIDLPEEHIGSRTGLYDLRAHPDMNVFVGWRARRHVTGQRERRARGRSARVRRSRPGRMRSAPTWPPGWPTATSAPGRCSSRTRMPDDVPRCPSWTRCRRRAASLPDGVFYRLPINVTFTSTAAAITWGSTSRRASYVRRLRARAATIRAKNTTADELPAGRASITGPRSSRRPMSGGSSRRRTAGWLRPFPDAGRPGREAFDAPDRVRRAPTS